MNFKYISMNLTYAKKIISSWKYEGIYSLHDYSNEEDHIMDKDSWGKGLFAVLNDNNELIGELTIDFFSKDNNPIEYKNYNKNYLRNTEMWIGFGLKPAMTGKGLGFYFVYSCINFCINKWDYKGEYIKLGVPKCNIRAIKVYQKIGFEIFNETSSGINGKIYEVFQMRKSLNDKYIK